MDETLTRLPWMCPEDRTWWESYFTRPKRATWTPSFSEWFHAFAQNAGITLHVQNLYGENNHHIAETCFKGLARALREAVAVDPRQGGRVPSKRAACDEGQPAV